MLNQFNAAANEAIPDLMGMVEFLSTTDRGSGNIVGLARTAAFIEVKLLSLGCDITKHDSPGHGVTLVGRKQGTGERTILLFAHYDTIWPAGTCDKWPYRIEGDVAYGPGNSDCTNGIIASLGLLQVLGRAGFDDFREIIILFNPDEEITSPSSTRWIEHYAKMADLAFCMEGPDNADEYVTSRGGSAYFDIRVEGRRAHAGVEPEKGRDAIQELVFKLNEIQRRPVEGAYLCVVEIGGGSGDCTVADNAHALLRYRITTPQPVPALEALLAEIQGKTFIDGTKTTITYQKGAGFGPMARLPWVDTACQIVAAVSAEMSLPLKEVYCGGGDDAVSASTHCPTLDGLAPFAQGCHTRDERLYLSSIAPRLTLLSEVVRRFCTAKA